MADDALVYDNFLNALASLDGKLIGAALATSAYVPLATDPTIDDITGEATGTGYARQTFTCDYESPRCFVADADQWPTFDTSDLDSPHDRVVFYLAEGGDPDEGKLISNILFGTQAPSSGWVLEPANGFAGARRTPSVPEPQGQPEGWVPTVNADGDYELRAPSGGTAPGDWVDWTLASPWANLADPPFGAPFPRIAGRKLSSEMVQVRGRIIANAADVAAGGTVSLGSSLAPSGQRPTDDALLVAKVAMADASFHTTSLAATVTLSASGEGAVDLGFYGPDGVTSFADFLTAASADFIAVNFGGTYSLT